MIDDTKAANSGLDQPLSFESSTCTKSSPKNGWLWFSMRPYMSTPQPVQACRWMAALASTVFSFCSLAVTVRLSRPTTATTENLAPGGFQHLVQPQAWLWATLPLMETVTGSEAQWQVSVPPLNFLAP